MTLWRRVLNCRDVDPDRSFFEQGGTSLAALSVLSYYNNSRLTLSLAQFYEQPTARGQANLLGPQSADLQNHPAPSASSARSRRARRLILPVGVLGMESTASKWEGII